MERRDFTKGHNVPESGKLAKFRQKTTIPTLQLQVVDISSERPLLDKWGPNIGCVPKNRINRSFGNGIGEMEKSVVHFKCNKKR
jgi:hypothetical protein